MATKTISLEIDAYERLRKARRTPSESFSSVVRRAVFPGTPGTAGEILAMTTRRMVKEPTDLHIPPERTMIVDTTFLIDLEREVARGKPGPAMGFLARVPATVRDARAGLRLMIRFSAC